MQSYTINSTRLEGQWFYPDGDCRDLRIVLLHEGLGCVALWRHFPTQLAKRLNCGVFAYSRVGYGQSDPVALPRPITYMHDEATLYLGPLLDELGLDRVVLLGHSDGASIATIYAGESNDPRIGALILIAPHLFVEDVSVASIARARDLFDHGDLRSKLERYHGSNVDCAFNGWCDAWLSGAFTHWDISDSAKKVFKPTLVIQGENDEYGTIQQIERIEQCFKGSVTTAMLEQCGHAPPFEHPKQTLARIEDFLVELNV